MQITEAQAKVLHRYMDEIEWQLGISLGCCSLWGAFLNDDNDFVIHEEGRLWDAGGYMDGEVTSIHLFHPLDYQTEHAGILVTTESAEFPLHDDQCAAFLKRIMHALEDGSLSANPSLVTEVKDMKIQVTKMGGKPSLFSVRVDEESGWHGATDDVKEKPNWIENSFYTHGKEAVEAIKGLVNQLMGVPHERSTASENQ